MASDRATTTLHRSRILVDPLPVIIRPGVPSKPVEWRLESGKCVIGSGSRCTIVIDAPTVSRTHVELTLVPEGVMVQDLGSRNGTFYMGQRIHSAVLTPGAPILLGSTPIAIELDREHLVEEGSSLRASSFRGMLGSGLLAESLGSIEFIVADWSVECFYLNSF